MSVVYAHERRLSPGFLPFASANSISSVDFLRSWVAARTRRVHVRGAAGTRRYDETAEAFAARIDRGQHDGDADLPLDRPVLAALFSGDIALPADSESYVLFPEVTHGSVAAADWLA